MLRHRFAKTVKIYTHLANRSYMKIKDLLS